MPQLNWSHFKPEVSGKPEKDAEAILLRMNDWMDTHQFEDGVNIQHFCLTLVVEARLWHESLRPINKDWIWLQNQFRQQYSKKAILENNYLTHGDLFISMRIQKHYICYMHKTSSYTITLWRTSGIRSFHEYTFNKTILGTFPFRRPMTNSRNSKENIDRRKDRQTISRTTIFHTVHEYKRWVC